MRNYIVRVLRLVLGLFLFALGVSLTIRANIGLAPWDAFAAGFSNVTGLSFGTVTVVVGAVILVIVLLLRERIGLGTILNTLLIGAFIDLIMATGLIPLLENFWAGTVMLLTGHVIICVGSYFYIGAAFGCGPRDSLMIALGKRLRRVPIGVVRSGIEAAALAAGWLMGAKVGLGTVISVLGIGVIFEWTTKLLRFDVRAVEHESVFDTARAIRNLSAKV